jgi:hypothetical protein
LGSASGFGKQGSDHIAANRFDINFVIFLSFVVKITAGSDGRVAHSDPTACSAVATISRNP